jgi:hypothetical protein
MHTCAHTHARARDRAPATLLPWVIPAAPAPVGVCCVPRWAATCLWSQPGPCPRRTCSGGPAAPRACRAALVGAAGPAAAQTRPSRPAKHTPSNRSQRVAARGSCWWWGCAARTLRRLPAARGHKRGCRAKENGWAAPGRHGECPLTHALPAQTRCAHLSSLPALACVCTQLSRNAIGVLVPADLAGFGGVIARRLERHGSLKQFLRVPITNSEAGRANKTCMLALCCRVDVLGCRER